MRITILNFSGRKNGNCHGIAQVVCAALAGHVLSLSEMHDMEIAPCGKCDYECFRENTACPYAGDNLIGIYKAICTADLAIYIVPNYCDYPCAHFFAFNERSQCFFQNAPEKLDAYLQVKKKFIVVSNTGKENFLQAFQYHVEDGMPPDTLFLAAKEYGKSSINGDLTDSVDAMRAVAGFVRGVNDI
ncbi:MAG: NAD(P)H-dependent oxidoreductase [Clostridiales bacterium]|nr:NAD(P)H-dependent oxidoreductase [Clostridiales bacterium]